MNIEISVCSIRFGIRKYQIKNLTIPDKDKKDFLKKLFFHIRQNGLKPPFSEKEMLFPDKCFKKLHNLEIEFENGFYVIFKKIIFLIFIFINRIFLYFDYKL